MKYALSMMMMLARGLNSLITLADVCEARYATEASPILFSSRTPAKQSSRLLKN